MKLLKFIMTGVLIYTSCLLYGQTSLCEVNLLPFNTSEYDEFSPVYYKDELVFCSNRKNDIVVSYTTANNQQLLDIYIVSKNKKQKWSRPKVFSTDLITNYHDGPICFNDSGTVAFFTRNNNVLKKIGNSIDPGNKLGLYSAILQEGKWVNINPFKENKEEYVLTHPSLAHDGTVLYFASDIPGGFGGTDLYYCNLVNGEWSHPINLGNKINTAENELFPFIHESGRLYFSSEGHQGMGGLDIFYTDRMNNEWSDAKREIVPINSEFDDFGIIVDSSFNTGYFSSNRGKTDDIYSFTTLIPAMKDCDSMLVNNLCYEFFESGKLDYDTMSFDYEWDLGDGERLRGVEVDHCYQKPGEYKVQLNIVDTLTGEIFLNEAAYDLVIEEIKQVRIIAEDTALVNNEVSFDGLNSKWHDFNVREYYWDFGDGEKSIGPVTSHKYTKDGVYSVHLQLVSVQDTVGNEETACVFKDIVIRTEGQNNYAGEDEIASLSKEISDILYVESVSPDKLDYADTVFNLGKIDSVVFINAILEQCDSLQDNNYCFVFYEAGSMDPDTTTFFYEWDMGDGTRISGLEVEHCFKEPGEYLISLNVVDTLTGKVFKKEASYNFILDDTKHVFINSADTCFTHSKIKLNGNSAFRENNTSEDLLWSFSDGKVATGNYVCHTFTEPGKYKASLKHINKTNESINIVACVYKNIVVVNPALKENIQDDRPQQENAASNDVDESTDTDIIDSEILAEVIFADSSLNLSKTDSSLFVSSVMQECDSLQEDNYCFLFYEAGSMDPDTTTFFYEWDMGDGTSISGLAVEHCFKKPGEYMISLNVVDTLTGKVYKKEASYNFTLKDQQHIFINSVDTCFAGTKIEFLGNGASRKNDSSNDFIWSFGDGTIAKGNYVSHVFNKPGQYKASLKHVSKTHESSLSIDACVYKNIVVVKK